MEERPSAGIAGSQARTFSQLFETLRPHLRTDRNLPGRIQQTLARERRFGSRDRRLYRELLYTAVRYLPWVEADWAESPEAGVATVVWLTGDTPATQPLRAALLDGWPATPATVGAKAAHLGRDPEALLPAWFREHCPAAFVSPDLDVLHTRAPLWVRLQTDAPETVTAQFAARGWTWRASSVLPDAGEVLTEADLTATDTFARGQFEVQDLGSQLLLHRVGVTPGGRWLDACAGAGGKTLQLARLLGPGGRVDAHDIRASALDELGARAARARIANIRILSAPPAAGAAYDGVLVDAPCSGSGTWRRSPHLKWTTTAPSVVEAARLQGRLLRQFSAGVRSGGLLVYATCSLSRAENEEVVNAFLAEEPTFAPATVRLPGLPAPVGGAPGVTLRPSLHNTDGYYVAALRRA